MDILKELAVIIPFHGKDLLWKDLLSDLRYLPEGAEILLVGPNPPDSDIFQKSSEKVIANIRYVPSSQGRAIQMNNGVKATDKNFLWFVHADSKIPRPTVKELAQALNAQPEALHCFHLQFLSDGPKLTQLNGLMANWRAKYLGMPFGDQGFAIRRAEFYRVGGFPESEPYGEDHVFVWEARRKRVPLNVLAASIFTSARRYEEEGWGRLTRKRVFLTTKQASQEIFKLFKERVAENWRGF